MQSFRSEIENPVVEKEIIELEKKIRLYKEGKVSDSKMKNLRLIRGIYGQRQAGVQMIRIKIPYGKFSAEQLRKIADVSDEYSRGRLHITTRQDIQIHYVSLDRTPQLWEDLEKSDITLREACGNVIRNVTASETAGIDPKEPFDVSPYADALFRYFLRNPVSQELGRKIKISFSASEEDTALSFVHDLGFIAKIKDGKRGFKVLLAGGIGAQPHHAKVAYDFLAEDKIIPFAESVIRFFDYFGERDKRMKARMKFLLKEIGLEAFLKLVKEQEKALPFSTYPIDTTDFEKAVKLPSFAPQTVKIEDVKEYEAWKTTNVFEQKQDGLFAIGIKIYLGDFYTSEARKLADIIEKYGTAEGRFTIHQNILLRNIKKDYLPEVYLQLKELGFATVGYNTTVDITACPGTDTCNLGIASSTGITAELEKVILNEYPEFLYNKEIKIKISGCMNACGQHGIAQIGYQGMTINKGGYIAPALQILLGGGTLADGSGRFADKLIKIPSKRGPESLRILLDDYKLHKTAQESFLDYYDRQGKKYFFGILKELSLTENLTPEDFIDWGSDAPYKKAIGIGECAAVTIDLVSTLLLDSEEKLSFAKVNIEAEKWADSIFHSYASLINAAKAVLITDNHKTNRYGVIVKQFDTHFVETGLIPLDTTFYALANGLKNNPPSREFAIEYLQQAESFYHTVQTFRKKQLENGAQEVS